MGQGDSKPAPSSSEHVFTSQTPVRFSQNIIESLQTSPESDSTRAKDLEMHIQARVQNELRRLEAETSKTLAELQDKLTSSDSTSDPSSSSSSSSSPSLFPGLSASDPDPNLSRSSVQAEIETLRKRLSRHKLKEEVASDAAVEKARDAVVTCLRVNDRRPLDCWKEVEAFKREVGRLEGVFLEKVLE